MRRRTKDFHISRRRPLMSGPCLKFPQKNEDNAPNWKLTIVWCEKELRALMSARNLGRNLFVQIRFWPPPKYMLCDLRHENGCWNLGGKLGTELLQDQKDEPKRAFKSVLLKARGNGRVWSKIWAGTKVTWLIHPYTAHTSPIETQMTLNLRFSVKT